jgi:hypothetical protein
MTERKLYMAIILALLIASSSLEFSTVFAIESPADTGQALVFLKDVVGIDVEKYEVTLTSSSVQDYTNADNPIGNLGYIQTSGMYELACWDTATETYSALKVMFSFANTTLRLCSLEELSGQPWYSRPLPPNTLEATTLLLERYETLSGDTELTSMKNMLTTVDVTKNSTKIDGNLKLEVTATSDYTSLSWIQSQNGVDYGVLTLEFKNDVFLTFFDSRSYCKVGSAEVNILKEQAIDMAMNEANGFSYTYNGKLVDNLTIVESQIRAELKANARDNPTLFYPCWIVDLPLNDVYPGSVYFIEVKIWADNGQIISCKTMGYGGTLPSDGSSSDSNTDGSASTVETDESFEPPWLTYIAVAVSVAVVAVVGAFLLVYFKKRKPGVEVSRKEQKQ